MNDFVRGLSCTQPITSVDHVRYRVCARSYPINAKLNLKLGKTKSQTIFENTCSF